MIVPDSVLVADDQKSTMRPVLPDTPILCNVLSIERLFTNDGLFAELITVEHVWDKATGSVTIKDRRRMETDFRIQRLFYDGDITWNAPPSPPQQRSGRGVGDE